MDERPLIYLKNSTTTALDPRVRERMLELLEEDPRQEGSLLADGTAMKRVVEEGRGQVARWCGARPEEIIFTSSGTESCNLALKGVMLARREREGRILAAATEHSAVLYPARTLAKLGFELREIPVDRHGTLRSDRLEELLRPGDLVSVALATAETGTLQSVREIARSIRERGALLHVDACLAAAYQPVDVGVLGADLVSFSAHKLGGPRGVGALFARDGVRLLPLVEGGVSEGGRRGGAPFVAGIAGFGAAADLFLVELPREGPRLSRLGTLLEEGLIRLPGVLLNGHPVQRLRAVVNVSVRGLDGESLALRLGSRGIAASSGSSCFEEAGKPSHVLLAMGMSPSRARGSLCLAVGRGNTEEEISAVIEAVSEASESLRAFSVEFHA